MSSSFHFIKNTYRHTYNPFGDSTELVLQSILSSHRLGIQGLGSEYPFKISSSPNQASIHPLSASPGTKFFVVCEPGTQHMEALLKVVYELYTDYVLKNPFYEMEIPTRFELFDINLT
ncbi:hypothetical protein GOBAR_DD09702 [Gossypium barbadense]|nr:hypothetical protein GOBAR_DD09702 [Gossypium barbadense]